MEIKLIVKASWSVKFTSRSKQEAHIPLASRSEICYEEDIREFLHFVKLKIKEYKYCVPIWKSRKPSSLQARPMAEEPVMFHHTSNRWSEAALLWFFLTTFWLCKGYSCACACVVLIPFWWSALECSHTVWRTAIYAAFGKRFNSFLQTLWLLQITKLLKLSKLLE